MTIEWDESKKNIMSKKIIYNDDARYTDAPLEVEEAFARSVRIKDFLPPPSELGLKVEQKQEQGVYSKGKIAPTYRRAMAYA